MKRKLFLLLLLMHLFATNNDADDNKEEFKENYRCKVIFSYYGIDTSIKSYKGWLRVCNNNKLYLYTNNKKIYKEIIYRCFKDTYKDREVEVIQ